jgi:hypothetical protein
MLTETNPTLTGAADCPDPHQSQQRESMSGSGYPKFKNDRGVPEICIGVREFMCIGESPPQATRTSTSIWARRTRSCVPTARRGSASILD